jgi:DNA-binding response OmpR family regulator
MVKQNELSRILLIEDQESIRKLIGGYLRINGFEVFEAWSLSVARRVFNLWNPKIVLLDLILEDEDGLDFLREQPGEARTIVISAKGSAADRIKALEIGADDYLVKPIEPRELLLKIRKLQQNFRDDFSRAREEESFADLTMNLVSRTVSGPFGKKCRLSQSEFILFRMLLGQIGVAFEKNEISRTALGHNLGDGSRAVDVMVSKLRGKLRSIGSQVKIQNVRERGYLSFYDRNEAEGSRSRLTS